MNPSAHLNPLVRAIWNLTSIDWTVGFTPISENLGTSIPVARWRFTRMDDLSISVLQEIENLLFHVELKYTWAIQGDHNNLRKFIFAPDKFIKIYTDFPDLSGHEIGSKLINENNFDLKFIYEDLNTVTMQFRVSAERRGWLANKND